MSLFLCNPALNKKCRRRKERDICQRLCILTTLPWCSDDFKPLTEEEVELYEGKLREKVEPGIRIGRHVDNEVPVPAAVEEEPDTELDKPVREEANE